MTEHDPNTDAFAVEPTRSEARALETSLETSVALPRVSLHVVSGPDTGRSCDSDEEQVLRAGARDGNHLILSDKSVSGYHLEVSRVRAGWRLRDLGSTNGTFIGPVRVYDVLVRPGTLITVGRSQIRLDACEDTPVRVPLHPSSRLGELVGQSERMRQLFVRIRQVAQAASPVLITGEAGSGKKALAETLFLESPRAGASLVVIDCAAMSLPALSSELLGHVQGAFPGAVRDFRGAFERARGGTVLLDEISELPLPLQSELLRVLERHEVKRLGSDEGRLVDVRVIAATRRALTTEVNERRFRQDLFHRLAAVRLEIPPLRERREDIPLLIAHFYRQLEDRYEDLDGPQLSEIIDRLDSNEYDWPGNVRELRAAVERTYEPARAPEPAVTDLAAVGEGAALALAGAPDLSVPLVSARQALVADLERRYLEALLKATRGNVTEAARRAQIDRMALRRLVTLYRLHDC